MSGLKLNLDLKLQQKLSPQQIQFIKLLQLNTLDLEKRVEEELLDNPAMEESLEDEDDVDAKFGEDDAQGIENELAHEGDEFVEQKVEIENQLDDEPVAESVDDSVDDLYDLSNYDYEMADGDDFQLYEESDPNEERKEMPIASATSFHDYLTEQFEAIVTSEKEEVIGLQIIGSLDDDGYLRRELPAISNDLAFTQNVETNINELEAVLKKIQSLDPAGIAARSLQECLLLQLKRKDNKDLNVKLATTIIEKYIDDFTKKHYDRLCKSLKIEEPELKRAIEVIIHLNPKPGDISVADKSNYIIPDFTVTNEGNKLLVMLNNRNVPPLRVSRSYIDTIKSYEKNPNNKQLKDSMQYIKQKIDGARWFIESIKQRHNTLMLTMNAIVEYQREFFFEGDERSLKPMILKDIAQKVSLDISTISRVASSKYVDTEFGIFPLKFFFSEGMTNEDGEEVSNKEIKKILTECIAAEDKRKPLPDEILMDILKKKGYGIARRTVAKYREQLNIPVARLRREL